MCGIIGLVCEEEKEFVKTFQKALGKLSHRGPDFCDFIQYQNTLLGHTRLSILDLSTHSNQPMTYEDKYTLVFNGEIYNYKELKTYLSLQGYTFHTQSDTEVLLCAYDFWGEDCVLHFKGMWAFVILDRIQNKLFCSRDRFGEKPFFYYQEEGKFIFASEIKAILPFMPKVLANIPALIPFIARGHIDCYKNETCFKGIYRLLSGENMSFNLKDFSLHKSFYHTLKQESGTISNPYTILRNLLEDSVKLRLRSDVRVGSALSGGLDSSILNALIAKFIDKKDFIAIHAQSSLKENDESAWAKQVAKHLGIELCIITPTHRDFLDNLEQVIKLQDEPFGSTSIYMQYFVMQKAKELGIKVMLDGQGADEVFLGYESYLEYIYKAFKDTQKEQEFFETLKSFRYTKEMILQGVSKVDDFEVTYSRIKEKSNIYPQFLDKEILESLFAYKDWFSFNVNVIKVLGLPALLRYEDRNSMGGGVEARLPYLDDTLVDFVINLPLTIKFQKGYLKYFLRKACEDLLPNDVIWRYNKLGFESPQKMWLEGLKGEMTKSIKKSQILQVIFKKVDIREENFMWRLYNIAKWEELLKVEI